MYNTRTLIVEDVVREHLFHKLLPFHQFLRYRSIEPVDDHSLYLYSKFEVGPMQDLYLINAIGKTQNASTTSDYRTIGHCLIDGLFIN